MVDHFALSAAAASDFTGAARATHRSAQVNAMTLTSRNAAVLLVAAAVLMPAGAQAQWYSSAASPPPLYPYAVRADRPYAVEVAPNTYVIQRPAARRQSHVQSGNADVASATRGRSRTDSGPGGRIAQTRQGDAPGGQDHGGRAREAGGDQTKRYVDDPPRVIERYNVVDDKVADGKPARTKGKHVATAETGDAPVPDKHKGKDEVKRVINAEGRDHHPRARSA